MTFQSCFVLSCCSLRQCAFCKRDSIFHEVEACTRSALQQSTEVDS